MSKFGVKFNKEKVESKGEDGEPVLLFSNTKNSGIISVFDGMGGAGATSYNNLNGKPISGAKISSSVVSQSVGEFFEKILIDPKFFDDIHSLQPNWLADLKKNINTSLENAKIDYNIKPSIIKSKLIKTLPTTIAGIYFQKNKNDFYDLYSFWSGDSRNYILNLDESGLSLLSLDDLNKNLDAFQNLKSDAPLSNFINLDIDYKINLNIIKDIKPPFLLLSCTDGCFHYWNNPMEFEYNLLSIGEKQEFFKSEFYEELNFILEKVAGDDFSYSIVLVDENNLNGEQLKKMFSKILKRRFPYYKYYKRKIDQSMENFNLNESEKLDQKLIISDDAYLKASSLLWEYYKIQFEKYIYELIKTEE